jgi:Tfp pilus assembly protein PilO
MALMDDLNKYKNTLLNVVLVLAALVVSYNLYEKQDKVLRELKRQKAEQVDKNKVLEEIGMFDQKIKALKDGVNKNDVSLSLNTISRLAKANSIGIISIRPLPKQSYPLYTKYPFTLEITIENGYNSLGMFISDLENDPGIYFVESVNIRNKTSAPQGGSPPERSLAASVTVYTIMFN